MGARFREHELRRRRSQTRGKLGLKGGHGQALVWRREERTFLPVEKVTEEKSRSQGARCGRAVAGRRVDPLLSLLWPRQRCVEMHSD